MFIFIILFFMSGLIYFLSMVCLQYSRIVNINLQFGMDVTELYSDDDIIDKTNYLVYSVKSCAMFLYKISTRFK